MKRRRGRPKTPLPVHPERVISTAVQTGLSSIMRLQRSIKNKVTQSYYESSEEKWKITRQVYLLTKERGNADYSYIIKAAPLVMDNMLKMLNEKIAEYGHTTVNRQKNADGTVDPFNQRLNACGAALRNFAVTMFPMPEPVQFGVRTQRAGKKRKKFRIAGYEGSSFGPRVLLSHPDLAPLDFCDAVRGHNEFLAAYTTIRNVPVNETTRYSNLFLLSTRSYLEHLYSEYKLGKPAFRKGVNKALGFIKHLVSQEFEPVLFKEKTVSKQLDYREPSEKAYATFFINQHDEATTYYGSHPTITEFGRLIEGGFVRNPGDDDPKEPPEEPCLTKRDAEHLRIEALKRARFKGSILHRRISDLFPSPWDIRNAIYDNQMYLGPAGYSIVSEVPIRSADLKGKMDLVLLEPSILKGKRGINIPGMIFEIKTHLGQAWYIEAEEKISESRRHKGLDQRIVSNFPLRDRPVTNSEWDALVNATPRSDARIQLNNYAEMLKSEYQTITKQSPSRILMGTIVIEAIADIDEVRRVIESLIVKAYETVRKKTGTIKRTVITPTSAVNSRIALVIHEQDVPKTEREEVVDPSWKPLYSPFSKPEDNGRQFILYLAGHTRGSASESAAWNARYYHGLQKLNEMKESLPEARIVWLDLADQFTELSLAETRLHLRPRGYSEQEATRSHPDSIQELFESFDTRGFLNEIMSFLYHGEAIPSFELENSGNVERIIVVSGADALRDATPSTHRNKLQLVFDNLLGNLPDDKLTKVLWFDSPVPSTEKAIPYSARALLPFYENSSLREFVTEIIWNLSVSPQSAIEPDAWTLPIIGDSPMHDDIRVAIRHSPKELDVELLHIPLLRGWSKRFKNQGYGLIFKERALLDIVPSKDNRTRMKLLAFTLLPWLVRLHTDVILFEDSKDTLGVQYDTLIQEVRGAPKGLTVNIEVPRGPPDKALTIFDLLRFRPFDMKTGKSYMVLTENRISSPRLYRSPNKLKTRPRSVVERPLPEKRPEEIEQDWVYGVKFLSMDDEVGSWWVVIQDPIQKEKLSVGCFTDKPPDKDGFTWAVKDHEVLTRHSLDDILGFQQVLMLCRPTEQGFETWSLAEVEQAYSGILELKTCGYSSIKQILAMKQTFDGSRLSEPFPEVRPNESFFQHVASSLRRYIDRITSPTPVKVKVDMMEISCRVTFYDEEETIFQEVDVEYTAHLQDLLRWPMSKGKPMYTDEGRYVTWNVFDDIDYGELDFFRPYVVYKAAMSAPEELPQRVQQFFEEASSLQVSIEHDRSSCPIGIDEEVEHGSCWRITLPSDCPKPVRRQLDRLMTGEEVNGLLAPGRILVGRLYTFEFSLPKISEMDASIVFHEERYIRILLREKGLILKRLIPGTYLHVNEQKWSVEPKWDGSSHIRWDAESTVTGLRFKGNNHLIELQHGQGAKEECERILNIITTDISKKSIHEYHLLEEKIMSGLTNRGYSSKSPSCEIRLFILSETSCKYGVYPVGGDSRLPLLEKTITLTGEEESEHIINEIGESLREADGLGAYNIKGVNSFRRKLSSWATRALSKLSADTDESSTEDEQEDEDEETTRAWENAQRYMLSAISYIGMREYESALRSLEYSLEILLGIGKRTEETQFTILRVLLMKNDVLEKQGLTDRKHLEEMKGLVKKLETKMPCASRPLYEQKVIEQVKGVLTKRRHSST